MQRREQSTRGSRRDLLGALIAMLGVLAVPLLVEAGGGQLQLFWTDNASNEDGIAIERSSGPSGPFQQIALIAPNLTSYTDSALVENTVYCYRVRAFNAAGPSSYSNSACGTARPLAALPTLTLDVSANPTMIVSATLTPGQAPVSVDAYVVLQLPDGTFWSLVPGGFMPGIAPAARGITPVSYSGEIFRYTFTGVEAAGTYTWLGGLVAAGTLQLLGNVTSVPFTYIP